MPFSAGLIEDIQKLDPKLRVVFIDLLKEIERDREESISRKEFLEFAKRSMEESVSKKEFYEFAQRTEENFRRVWEAIEALTKGQKELIESHNRLVSEHRETRRQLGGLAQAWGYTLENESYKALPGILEKNHGVKLKERLKRGFLTVTKGQKIEVNIIGRGQVGEKEVLIIGECKSQLSKNDIDNFISRKLERIKEVVDVEIFPIVVTHMTSLDDVEDYARQKGLLVYYSYDFI